MSIFDRLKKQPTADTAATPAKSKATKATKSDVTTAAAVKTTKRVLVRPLVTEKATLTNTYAFLVARDANKPEIAKAVETQYGVKPKHVRVMNMYGKQVRWNNRAGKRADWKKAIVTLPQGKTINVYEALS